MLESVGGEANEGNLIVGFLVSFLCCPFGLLGCMVLGGRDTKVGALFALAFQLLFACMGGVSAAINAIAGG